MVVSESVAAPQALARANAMIRDVDQRRGLQAADAFGDLTDHNVAVLAAYRDSPRSRGGRRGPATSE